jgi:HSP20 family protein
MFVYPVTRSFGAQSVTRALERFFDDGFAAARIDVRTPELDVIETDSAFRLVYDVPGLTRESLKATVEGRRVVLETVAPGAEPAVTAKADASESTERTLYRERVAPRYGRTVVLPAEVDAASAQARLEHGVLTLTVAKKQPAGKVEVRVA